MKKVKYVLVFLLSMLMTNGLLAQDVSYWQTKGDSLFNEGNKLIRDNHKEEAIKAFKMAPRLFAHLVHCSVKLWSSISPNVSR